MLNSLVVAFVSFVVAGECWADDASADYKNSSLQIDQRSTGLLFSAGTFSIKIGWSVGLAAAAWLLAYYGFKPNVQQNEQTLEALRLMMSVFPAIVALLAAGAVLLYKIDAKMEKELEAAMKPTPQ